MRTLFNPQPGEEIREIEDFPGYFASSFGRIISAPKPGNNRNKWIVLKACLDTYGYPMVALHLDGKKHPKTVHKLVCRAFHGNPMEGQEVCHRPDATKTNNRADNLVWDTEIKNAWDRELAKNLDFLQDFYVYKHKSPNLTKPFFIKIPIDGKQKGTGGCHATREEARMMRDWLCNKHGIPIPEPMAIAA
jgi:hypothetical protein